MYMENIEQNNINKIDASVFLNENENLCDLAYEELFWKSEDLFFGNFVAYNMFDVDEKLIKETEKFQEAIREELRAMEIYKTWEFGPRPENNKVLTTRWVLTEKGSGSDKICKARLVARGFEKVVEMAEIRSPVAKLSTFRIFLSV